MGASCCKVSKNKSLAGGAQLEVSQFRNVRHSPPWGFRWDNRTHIEDIMDTSSPASEPDIANFNGSEMKRMPTPDRRISSGGSGPSEEGKANRSPTSISHQEELSTSSQKIPTQSSKPALPTLSSSSKNQSDKISSGKSPISQNKSSRASFSSDAQSTTTSSPSAYRTQSLPSDTASSSSKSPLSQISRQASDNSHSHPASFNHDTNHWTFHTFTELVASSQKTKQSFDSEKFNFIRADAWRSNSDASKTSSSKGPICSICTKPLKERSPHGMQKLYSTNELSVAAVLDCGHVFHADCLEKLTPDVDRYDPECPRCNYRDKDLNKLILHFGNDNKINKTSKKHVDKLKSHSVKGLSGKPPFLKRYSSEGESSRKKGFFARFRD